MPATKGLSLPSPSMPLASSSLCISISSFSDDLCISSPWKAHVPFSVWKSFTHPSRVEAIVTIFKNWDGRGLTQLYIHTPGSWLTIRFVLAPDPRFLQALLAPATPPWALLAHFVYLHESSCMAMAPSSLRSQLFPFLPQALSSSHSISASALIIQCPDNTVSCIIHGSTCIVPCVQSPQALGPNSIATKPSDVRDEFPDIRGELTYAKREGVHFRTDRAKYSSLQTHKLDPSAMVG